MKRVFNYFTIVSILVISFNAGCTKDDNNNNAQNPILETFPISLYSDTTAESGGSITSDGGNAITERGICYSLNTNPTIADSKVIDVSNGLGDFHLTITGLTGNTLYHAKAYGINSTGVYYGSDISFTTALSPIITTIAGTGSNGFNGDNISAINAQIDNCRNIALDNEGNIYLSDLGNNVIRKITKTTGIISIIAGIQGSSGYTGDNGLAINAKLSIPRGLTVDASGNIYFADAANGAIRKINASNGIITTVAGGNFIAIAPYGDGGLATNACLQQPYDVKVDNMGNLFIADWAHHRVRKVNAATNIISTIAGNGSQPFTGDGSLAINAGVQYPQSLLVNSAGEVMIVTANRVRKIDNNGIINTIAGNGSPSFTDANDGMPATSVGMGPTYITDDSAGNIYLAGYDNKRILKINSAGIINTVVGNGYWYYPNVLDGSNPLSPCLEYAVCVAIDVLGNIYIADYGESRIRKVVYR